MARDIHVHIHNPDSALLLDMSRRLDLLIRKESVVMAIAQDILDAVTAETTVIDSFLALVDGLIKNNTVSAAQGAAILAAISADKAKIEAAIVANTPVA